MNLTILATLLTLLFASFALAVAPEQKAIIMSYDDNTPSHIIEQAIQAIKDAGGKITHEYKVFIGFAATAPTTVLETVQAWGNEYHAVIEEDQMVHTTGHDDY